MAGRNHNSKHRSDHRHSDDSSSRSIRRFTPAEVRIIEDHIAVQSLDIETLLHDNQRLATAHVALKQDVAAAQKEIRRLSESVPSVSDKRDAQVQEAFERSLKLEAEARSVEMLHAELDRVRGEIDELRDKRKELSEKLKDIEGDISSIRPELREFSDLKAEIEAWQREIRRGRAAIEYERKMHSNNLEISKAMELHMVSVAREAEKLRTKLAYAEQRTIAAGVDAVPAANKGPEYVIQQSLYGGNLSFDPHIVQPAYGGSHPSLQQPGYAGNSSSDPDVRQDKINDPLEEEKLHMELANAKQRATGSVVGAVSTANQGLGYAIQHPGYGGNSLSDPHVQQPGYGGNSVSDPHVQQPGYGGNSVSSVSDPHVQQPGYGENSVSDPHVQPQYGGNSLSNLHVQQSGYGGTLSSDPHAHQGLTKGKNPKKDGKVETNTKGSKPKCLKCKKKHHGECWNGKLKVQSNKNGGKPKCSECLKSHHGECLRGKRVCFRCKKPGHQVSKCKEKEPKENGKAQEFA